MTLSVLRRNAARIGLAIAGSAMLAWAAPSTASDDRPMLALGDSVAFGFIDQAGYAYVNPSNFVGYPYYVGWEADFDTTNAACPGETTSSFLSPTGNDNGCRAFRSTFPLHVAYKSTQADFAATYLARHPQTQLVTLGLGANDVLLLQQACAGDVPCIQAGLSGVLGTVGANMAKILRRIRATGFHGVLVVVNYYSLDYTDPAETGTIAALNDVLAADGKAYDAVIADVFSAFRAAASTPFAGGRTCRAGLLNADPKDPSLCDVHPSQSGQQLLADVIERTYRAATGKAQEQ